MTRVLICDDDTARVSVWKRHVEAHVPGAVVSLYTGANLALLVDALYLREQLARGPAPALTQAAMSLLAVCDQADIVVLDSDLSPAPADLNAVDVSQRESVSQILRNGYGDAIARQIRSYTTAKVVVVANMFWGRHQQPRVFDLTMTQDVGSHADVNIEDAELGDASLWKPSTHADAASYNPWKRPFVLPLLEAVSRSVEATTDLDRPVLSALGLDASEMLARQRDLFSDHDDIESVTFRQLAYSRLGFRYDGGATGATPHGEDAERRMAASVVRRWLRRSVLPPQTLIADAPHLFHRMWQLLPPEADSETWEVITDLRWDSPESVVPGGLQPERCLEPYLDIPVFSVRAAAVAVGKLEHRPDPAGIPRFTFAEDTSRFVSDDYDVEEFSSDLPGPFARRAVEELDGVGYEPAPRLLT